MGLGLGEKIEFDIFVRFSSAARAGVKISDGALSLSRPPTPRRGVRNEDFLSAVLSSVSTLDAEDRGVKGDGTGRLEGRREREECEMAAAAERSFLGRSGRKLSGRPRQEARD